MFKKTVQYEDLDGVDQEATFYFHLNKLEVMEMMQLEDLEGKIKTLTRIEDAKEAYDIFKSIIVRAYGVKTSADTFEKSEELARQFQSHLAFPEIILEMVGDPKVGAQFIEKCLPASMVKAAKEQMEKDGTLPAEFEGDSESESVETEKKANKKPAFEDFTRAQLLQMEQAQFQSLVPDNPMEMSKDQLQIAFERKSKQG